MGRCCEGLALSCGESIGAQMHRNWSEVFAMQMTFARWPLMAVVGLAVVLAEGCKRHVAPVASQPVVRSSPAVNTVPNFDDGPMTVESTGVAVVSNRKRGVSQLADVQPVKVQP